MMDTYTALRWQKKASDKSDISCKRAKCVCHFMHSVQYHDVLPNISLNSRTSVLCMIFGMEVEHVGKIRGNNP